MGKLANLEEGMLSFILLCIMLLSAVGAVLTAGWVEGLGLLPWIAFISLIWGLVFSRLPLTGLALHTGSLLVGAGVVAYFVCLTLPEDGLLERLGQIWERLN